LYPNYTHSVNGCCWDRRAASRSKPSDPTCSILPASGSRKENHMTALATLQRIDESRLEKDLGYRFGYVSEFMGFNPTDVETIHPMAPHLAPLVPSLVDAVYVKLFGYDATKRHFVPRQAGYEGTVPPSLDDLDLNHPQIQYRKAHLAGYLKKLVT